MTLVGNFYSPPCMAGRLFLMWWCRWCERSRGFQLCWMENSNSFRVKGYTQGWLQLLTASHVPETGPSFPNVKKRISRGAQELIEEGRSRSSSWNVSTNFDPPNTQEWDHGHFTLILWSQLAGTLNWTLSTSFYLKHASDLGLWPKLEKEDGWDGARVVDFRWTLEGTVAYRDEQETDRKSDVSEKKMPKCRSDPFVCFHSFELHKACRPTNGNAFCELHKTDCPTNGNAFCESYNPIRSCHNCVECDAVPSLDLLDLSGLTLFVAALAECCVECAS